VPSRVHVTKQQILAGRQEVLALHMGEPVEEYIVQLVMASRNPSRYNDKLARRISYGASPRATIALDLCARAHAWLEGRDYVSPEDVQSVAADVLRHRILISFEAEAEGVTADGVIGDLLRLVPVA
jgi:MoxR-like ATPase